MNEVPLEARVERLERVCRLQRRCLATAGLVLVGAFSLGMTKATQKQDTPAAVVRATKIQMIDSQGHVVGEWVTTDDGSALNIGDPDRPGFTAMSKKGEVSGVYLRYPGNGIDSISAVFTKDRTLRVGAAAGNMKGGFAMTLDEASSVLELSHGKDKVMRLGIRAGRCRPLCRTTEPDRACYCGRVGSKPRSRMRDCDADGLPR